MTMISAHSRGGVNKLSGIDTGLICTLAEKLMTTTAKDIRSCDLLLLGVPAPGWRSRPSPKEADWWQDYCGAGVQLHRRRDRSRKGRAGMARRYPCTGQFVTVPGGSYARMRSVPPEALTAHC